MRQDALLSLSGFVLTSLFLAASTGAIAQTADPAPQPPAAAEPQAEEKAAPQADENAAPQADENAAPQADENAVPQPAEPAEAAPKAGPKYLYLRYDEDFSYLDGPAGSYQPDFFDPIKNIHLGEDLRLSLGGEFRFRMESETNKAFGATEPANDTFQVYRYFLHADLKYRNLFRVFAQGAVIHDEDRDLALRPIDENILDLQQLFFDLRFLGEDVPLTLRVGRQELYYGAERFVSPFDWASTRRRFDAVKLFWTAEDWKIDVFYAKPVIVQRRQRDRYNEDFDFYGLYVTYSGIPRHGIDAYFLAVDDTGAPLNPNFKAGDVSRYTIGSRFWGKTAGFDYETEVAGQWGRWAGDTIQAWSVSANGGHTWDFACQPRLGAGFDWASGDNDPTDGKVGTFDQLFPLGHKYFGFLDLVGRQNVTAVSADLSAWVVPKKVKGQIAYQTFWLAARKDALYNAGAAPTRRDITGRSGREMGHELDLTVTWNIDHHSNLLLGYSHLWDSDFIINTGPSEDVDFFYVQFQFKF